MKSDYHSLPFTGAAAALITPFSPDGAVDYSALGRLIEFQIESGTDSLVILGTTGETSALTDDERRSVIRFAAKAIERRIPLIVGTGSNDTAHTVELTRFACSEGADGILAVTPYYNRPSPTGLTAHFSAAADASEVPVILYNVPSRTGTAIPHEVYRELSAHPNIAAVKEASGNVSEAMFLTAETSLAVYCGNDELTVPIASVGGVGVISVLANVMPREVSALCRMLAAENFASAREDVLLRYPLIRVLFSETNPIPIKAACAMAGLCGETLRLPLTPMSAEKRTVLRNLLIENGVPLREG